MGQSSFSKSLEPTTLFSSFLLLALITLCERLNVSAGEGNAGRNKLGWDVSVNLPSLITIPVNGGALWEP